MKIEEFIRKYGTDIAVGDMPATMPLKSRDISFGEAAEKNTAEIIRLQKLLETVENETARKRIQNDLDKLLKKTKDQPQIFPTTFGRGGTEKQQMRMERMDISEDLKEMDPNRIVPKPKPEPDPKYEGPFGKLGEYLSENESARNKLFDMLGSVGRELVRPTQPGEARGLLSDISAGIEKGETQYSAEEAAAAEAALKYAQAQKAMSPEQYYTSTMKNVYDEAKKKGLKPGTTAYNEFVSERLRLANIGESTTAIAELLNDARERLKYENDQNIRQDIISEIDAYRSQLQELLGTGDGSTSQSATSIYDATK